MYKKQDRRSALKTMFLGAAALKMEPLSTANMDFKPEQKGVLKGNIHQSACYWVYQKNHTVEQFCEVARQIGLKAVDLLPRKDWPILKKYGLDCGIANGAEISLYEGFNHKEYHDTLVKSYLEQIPVLAGFGFKNLICFSGARKGIDDETGLNVCAEGLKRIMSLAEKHKVTITMELLNSKIDHHDYQCDHTAWGVELCKRVGSERFKLLYDIYHMQIMEGDMIRTITEYAPYISHYHTGGVPGRHELDDTQEINYPAVMRAILKTGYQGYVAQEFIPSGKNEIEALVKCVKICDV